MAPKSVLALLATASGGDGGDATEGLAGLAEAIAGLRTEDARAKVLEWLSERGNHARLRIHYKLFIRVARGGGTR